MGNTAQELYRAAAVARERDKAAEMTDLDTCIQHIISYLTPELFREIAEMGYVGMSLECSGGEAHLKGHIGFGPHAHRSLNDKYEYAEILLEDMVKLADMGTRGVLFCNRECFKDWLRGVDEAGFITTWNTRYEGKYPYVEIRVSWNICEPA